MIASFSQGAHARRVLVYQRQSLFLPFLCALAESSGASAVAGIAEFDPKVIRTFDPTVVYADLDGLAANPRLALALLRMAAPNARILAQSANASDTALREAGADATVTADADECHLRMELWRMLFETDAVVSA